VDGSTDLPQLKIRGNFHQLMELKRRYPRLKILISLEGRASDFAEDAQPESRAAFVASCVDLFLKGNFGPGISAANLFDGVDIDWEYPRGADSANYLPLLTEFRRQMDALRPGLLLSVALGASPHMYGDADVSAIGRAVDLAGLMTYDFNGPWSSSTGFIAPLSGSSVDDGSVEASVNAWKEAGVPAAKLLIGLPFYAYGWRSVADVNHGLGQGGSPIRGDHPYRFIQTLIDPHLARPPTDAAAEAVLEPSPERTSPSESRVSVRNSNTPLQTILYRDPVSQAPWLFDGSSFWTYEDPISIGSKAAFAANQQLAGFMIWELSGDSSSGTLLKAAHSALANPTSETLPVAQRSTASAPDR
jgi:chitinase